MNTRKIAICGSMEFFEHMVSIRDRLQDSGIHVAIPAKEEVKIDYSASSDTILARVKKEFIDGYLREIEQADAILVANFDKRGIQGYIGANTLMEISFAYALKKRIFVLHDVGEQPCRPEILGLQPQFLKGDVEALLSEL